MALVEMKYFDESFDNTAFFEQPRKKQTRSMSRNDYYAT